MCPLCDRTIFQPLPMKKLLNFPSVPRYSILSSETSRPLSFTSDSRLNLGQQWFMHVLPNFIGPTKLDAFPWCLYFLYYCVTYIFCFVNNKCFVSISHGYDLFINFIKFALILFSLILLLLSICIHPNVLLSHWILLTIFHKLTQCARCDCVM